LPVRPKKSPPAAPAIEVELRSAPIRALPAFRCSCTVHPGGRNGSRLPKRILDRRCLRGIIRGILAVRGGPGEKARHTTKADGPGRPVRHKVRLYASGILPLACS
jgi:hypothetical protein